MSAVHSCILTWFYSSSKKRTALQGSISALDNRYTEPTNALDAKIHGLCVAELVTECRVGKLLPEEILTTYGKIALAAHKHSNCLTDVMFAETLQTTCIKDWACGSRADKSAPDLKYGSPLLGVPIGIKDNIDIAGHDSTVGLSRHAFNPVEASAPIVRLLQDAGALLHVKTAVPSGLLGVETHSDLFGRTTNPYNPDFSAGASTGGGAALLGCGGSVIEVGNDLGGSVRIPAHFCGLYGLKPSIGRLPSLGCRGEISPLVPMVVGPMAARMNDLAQFMECAISMQPWRYDHTCIPMPWRPSHHRNGRKLKWGILRSDGKPYIQCIIPPSPACSRALETVIKALKNDDHDVVELCAFRFVDAHTKYVSLLSMDGQVSSSSATKLKNQFSRGETVTASVAETLQTIQWPRIFKDILAYISQDRDPGTAAALRAIRTATITEQYDLLAQCQSFRAMWHQKWEEEDLDFVITPPYPFPAIPHDTTEQVTLLSCSLTFLCNLLDLPAGVLPVTHVDKAADVLSSNSNRDSLDPLAQRAYTVYDPEAMHGLPVGVQIIGKRLEEENALEAMKIVKEALGGDGVVFEPRRRVH
ncbi:amidase signature enzyme [Fistulina hepatica ATCC 64428]|uniref:Amidase signature enzyme n=1 Tax=Fistulina hepatica ATCC 64428 TaxID=1128425 RepID=A0A0D7ACM5_9AGAR|nr:amidase signature enzyme [Fistulina hepatica ATCC 64428]